MENINMSPNICLKRGGKGVSEETVVLSYNPLLDINRKKEKLRRTVLLNWRSNVERQVTGSIPWRFA